MYKCVNVSVIVSPIIPVLWSKVWARQPGPCATDRSLIVVPEVVDPVFLFFEETLLGIYVALTVFD